MEKSPHTARPGVDIDRRVWICDLRAGGGDGNVGPLVWLQDCLGHSELASGK